MHERVWNRVEFIPMSYRAWDIVDAISTYRRNF